MVSGKLVEYCRRSTGIMLTDGKPVLSMSPNTSQKQGGMHDK